ncbi:MAG TPA: hypothetical protein VFO55_04710 [Gemmatimonadaceae bacterium]|nr:hypothetical protein [Gemmatimonadaceae bacterium]
MAGTSQCGPWHQQQGGTVYCVMPMTFEVDKAHHVLRSRATGPLTIDDLIGYLTESRAHPDFDPGMDRWMDLREITQLPSSEDVRALAVYVRTRAPVETARMAILASSDLAFGVAMMFKALVGYGDRLVVVRNEDDAADWLKPSLRTPEVG